MATYDERKVRNWLLLFYLKVSFLFLLIIMFLFSLSSVSELGMAFFLPLPLIAAMIYLIHRDIKQDPYGLMKFFREVFQAWWYMNMRNGSGQRSTIGHPYFRAFNQADLDIHSNVRVPSRLLKDGGHYVASIKLPGTCPRCDGDRTLDSDGILLVCSRCNGSGKDNTKISGDFYYQTTFTENCTECHGSGYVPSRPCPKCRGTGESNIKKAVKIKIPPNTTPGTVLRLRGMGLLDKERGLVGDLLIKVQMRRFF
ncbi:MAG: zinc finger domain-containing protein [Candidatus Odinarchaeota archaeon]